MSKFVPYALLALCWMSAGSGWGQSDTSTKTGPTQQEIDQLLLGENQALDRYKQEIAPAIHCDYGKPARQSCHDLLIKIAEEAEQAKQAIVRYQTYGSRQPVELFDIYVDLRGLLEDIQMLALVDDSNGHSNREPIASAYNSFVKITGVWFTGEMRETIRTANH